MGKDVKIITGIFALFIGFYILIQVVSSERFIGLAISAIGLYLILSNLK